MFVHVRVRVLPGFQKRMCMSGAVRSSNASAEMGTYEYIHLSNGMPAYQKRDGEFLYWADGQWRVGTQLGGSSSVHIRSDDNVGTPDLVTTWKTWGSSPVGSNDWAPETGLKVQPVSCTGNPPPPITFNACVPLSPPCARALSLSHPFAKHTHTHARARTHIAVHSA